MFKRAFEDALKSPTAVELVVVKGAKSGVGQPGGKKRAVAPGKCNLASYLA